jgi:hypothetical protein
MDPILFPERKRSRKKLDPGGPGLFDISTSHPSTRHSR